MREHAGPLGALGGADAAGLPPGGARGARWRPARTCSPRRPTTPRSSRRSAASVRVVPSPLENFKVTTPHDLRVANLLLSAALLGSAAVLTDLHVHLRKDDTEHPGLRGLHDRQRRPLPRGRRGARDHRSSASPSTSTASARRSSVWEHPFWRAEAQATTSTTTSASSASYTDLRVGIEADFVSGREDRLQNLLDEHRARLRRRLGALPRRPGRRPRRLRHLGHVPASARRGVEALLRHARRGRRRPGMFDILAHPDLVKVWGAAAAVPGGRPAPLLRPGDGGHRRDAAGDRAVHGRAAQAGRRAVPGDARSWRCASRRAARSRSRATPTSRRTSDTATRRRWRCLTPSECASSPCSRAGSVAWSRSV